MIVLIPCYNRPEFLSVALELITKAYRSEEMTYLFQLDFGHDGEVLKVIDNFKLNKIVEFTPVHQYPNKQSYSVLLGYQNALKHNPKYVFMVEDDVFIADDFFHWHLSVIDNAWASIATKNHNWKGRVSNNLAAYYKLPEYQSLGVCFHAKSVKEFAYPEDEYYQRPVNYVRKHFPKSTIPPLYSEQDGLIRRVIKDKNHDVVFPHVPRAFHAGYYGKSRGEKPQGNLDERIKQVKLTAFNPDIMKGDSTPELLVNPLLNYQFVQR